MGLTSIKQLIRAAALILLPSLAVAQPTLQDTTRIVVFDPVKSWVPNMSALKSYMFPSQTGNSGKYLTTDGNVMSWATVSGGGSGDILNGGNTTGADITIGTNDDFGLNLETAGVTRLSITGGASTGGLFTQTAVTASTGAIVDLQTLRVNSTGTAAANFGGGLLFQGESSTTDNQDMGRIGTYWTTATHASREAGFAFQLGNSAGALANVMTLDRVSDSDGQLKIGANAPVLVDNDEITYDADFSIKGSSFQNLSLLTTSGALYINGTAVSSGVGNPSTRVEINANSTGTPSTGFGPRILLTGESSTTNEQEMVGLRAAWTTATHASREARFTVQLGDNGGALADVFEVNRSSDADGAILIGTGNTLLVDNDEMTSSVPFTISGGTNQITIGGSSGNTIIGGTAGSGTIQVFSSTGNISIIRETSTTNTTIGAGFLARSSGTPAAGFGPKINFYAESSTTLDRDVGVIEAPWTTATDASRTSDMVFSTVNAGTTGEAFRVYGNKRAMIGGGTNQASAALQVTSTTGGFLRPKVTTTEMNAIASPSEGLDVYNTTEKGVYKYDGSNWRLASHETISGRSTGQTGAVASVATLTVGSTDATYTVSGNILVTTSSSESFSLQVDYTDEGNTARTVTIPILRSSNGAWLTATLSAAGAVPYPGGTINIRCKASTTITIKTTGTFTGCTYNVEGNITRIQ